MARELEPEFDLGGRYHTIIMNYVLEHFLDPLARALAGCRARFEPGGRVVVMTPNVDAWAHRLFGRSWSGLHAPRHTHLFNTRTLARAAEKAGFDEAKVETAFVTRSGQLGVLVLEPRARAGDGRGRAGDRLVRARLPSAVGAFALAERRLAGHRRVDRPGGHT